MIGLVKVVRFGDRFMEVGNFRDGLGVHNRPPKLPTSVDQFPNCGLLQCNQRGVCVVAAASQITLRFLVIIFD